MFVYFVVAVTILHSRVHTSIATSLLGLVLVPILTISYELAVTQTVHMGIGEAMSCGIINTLANTLGVTIILILTPYLKEEQQSHCIYTMIALAAMQLVAFILLCFVKA